MSRVAVLLALCAALLVPASPAAAEDWNVSVTTLPDGSQELAFDSPALHQRTVARVWAPALTGGDALLPTLYLLHDQVVPTGSALPSITALLPSELADAAGALVVAPDAGAVPWCATCLWTDGTGGTGVLAETHLVDELIPVVTAHLPVRADRGGRAVAGTGMGGTGAVLAAFRQPDTFGAVAGLDATLDLADAAAPPQELAWLATQGYPPYAAAEARYRDVSPIDLAPGVVVTGMELMLTAPTAGAEADRVSPLLTEAGVAHSYTHTDAPAAEILADLVAPRLVTTFARPAIDPWRASFKTVRPDFTVWGWDIALDRPNVEFLHVLGARLDGRDVILAGTGTAALTTPPAFQRGRRYTVTITPDPQSEDPRPAGVDVNPLAPEVRDVVADEAGRLHIDAVEVGPARTIDEREVLAAHGQFTNHHVRVEVSDGPGVVAAPRPFNPPLPDPASLPEPFSGWNVEVSTSAWDNPGASDHVQYLRFDSPTLGLRTGTQIYLPTSDADHDGLVPVAYHLHGTGYGTQAGVLHLGELLDELEFAVVVPDVDLEAEVSPFCTHCYWIDRHEPRDVLDSTPVLGDDDHVETLGMLDGNGERTEQPVRADTFLHEELLPLVEALLPVRTDRAGRGVMGNSMGALAARNQAFHHPDTFSVVSGLSGLYDVAGTATDPIETQWWGYTGWQGYPARVNAEALYRNISPLHLVPQMLGANVEAIATMGDACMGSERWCSDAPDINETYGHYHQDRAVPLLDTAGLFQAYPEYHGIHYSPDGEVWRRYHLERMNAAFADPAPEPELVTYKSVDTTFSVWGYDVSVDRPNHEFLNLLGARRDGRDFTLAGTGTASVTTPPAFVPGTTYTAAVSVDAAVATTIEVVADGAGRLTLTLNLGNPHVTDERLDLLASGAWDLPHTRVEITE